MQCFILAGGFATRLWPLTERRAKPLLPLAGKPLITHLVENVPGGIPITVSTNAVFADDFQAWAKGIKDRRVAITIEDTGHDDHKLGALGATAKWLTEEKISDDLLLLAGDNYVGFSIGEMLQAYKGNPLIAGHDIDDLERAKSFGTIVIKDESVAGTPESPLRRVQAFEEKPAQPRSTVISTGVSILPASSLPVLIGYAQGHPDNIGGIFEELLRQNLPVDCRIFTGPWKDIGSFGAYMDIHTELLGEKRIIDPSASVGSGNQLFGSIAVGPKATIEKSSLTDCIVFGQATIIDCVLERCIIDEHCELTGIDLSDKMLRAGTILRRR